MVTVDDKLINYLEDLSNISLTDEEKSKLVKDLQTSIDFMAQLATLNTENVPERSHPLDHVNDFRDDVVIPSFSRDLILKNAKEHNNEMFIAPRTVGD